MVAFEPPLVERSDARVRPTRSALTVDLEKLAPHRSSVLAETLRIETPCTILSLSAKHECLFASLVALEEVRREAAVARGERARSSVRSCRSAPNASVTYASSIWFSTASTRFAKPS